LKGGAMLYQAAEDGLAGGKEFRCSKE